jgi:YVTN family beta-propeller protein
VAQPPELEVFVRQRRSTRRVIGCDQEGRFDGGGLDQAFQRPLEAVLLWTAPVRPPGCDCEPVRLRPAGRIDGEAHRAAGGEFSLRSVAGASIENQMRGLTSLRLLTGLVLFTLVGSDGPLVTHAVASAPSAPAAQAPLYLPHQRIRDMPPPPPAPPPPPNVYAATLSGSLSPAVAGIPARVYVPNSVAHTVVVIDPATFSVVGRVPAGLIPHHVTPAPGLQRLYVNNEGSSTLTVIDPRTSQAAGTIPVPYPYNLYFTPDGRKAVVVVERLRRIEFRDPGDWHLLGTVDVPWPGVDHLDFSADGRHLLASTEWSGQVVRIDTERMAIDGVAAVGGLPIDVRLAPAGDVFLVTNQGRMGVSLVDGVAMSEVAFIPTGQGAHGLQLSRDTKRLFVTNRLDNSISVIDLASRQVVDTWRVSGGPDMTQLNPDGTQLWVSGRFDGSVWVLDTRNGTVLAHIWTGAGAHGLSYFPNAGAVSLGHNGVYR